MRKTRSLLMGSEVTSRARYLAVAPVASRSFRMSVRGGRGTRCFQASSVSSSLPKPGCGGTGIS